MKGETSISFLPLGAMGPTPEPATFTLGSTSGEAPEVLNTPQRGARIIINGITIPFEAAIHSAQNLVDIINSTANVQVVASLNRDGSLVVNTSPLGGPNPPVFTGDATLLQALGIT
jgi:hypothetical protein